MAKHDDMPRHDDPTELEPRPQPLPDSGPTATLAQLRQDIVSGSTGDKVAVLDPSMASLGTDDEAAGEPPSPEMIAAVRKAERSEKHSPLVPTDAPGDPRRLKMVGAIALAVVLAAVMLWGSFA
jgi:hypothetical protein